MTGDNLEYFYTVLLPVLEENFEKFSKTQNRPYLYQKVDNKNLKALSLANISETETIFSKEHIFFIFFYLGQLANKKVLS